MDEISQPIISKIEKLVIEEKETPQIIELKKYLNKQLKISLSDGRILQGKFWCVDNRKNLVIGEAVESRQISFQQESGNTRVFFSHIQVQA